MPPGPDVVEVLANSIGQYFWRVRAANGKTIATSGESFDSKYNAKRAAERMLGIDFPEDTDEMDLAVNVVTPDPGPPVEEGPTLRSTFRGVCSWCGEAIHFGMLVKVDNEGSFQHENCFEISLGEAPQ